MEIICEKIQINEISYAIDKYFTESTLLFDIECTGLSPRTAFIYLIGCAQRKGNEITYTQFFAKDYADERELLQAFNEYLNNFDSLLGFNSTRFDEPFILERNKKYQIDSKIKSMRHRDLYLTTTKAKVLLDLENYKQKTIERFLGLNRQDQYNGGELIPVYNHFSETGDHESKELVLLHNLEDVKGMVYILDILCYVDLLDLDLTYCGNEVLEDSFNFSFNFDCKLPQSINKRRDYGLYIIKDNKINVSLKTYNGQLGTFLPDFKKYYYLLNEDIIVPKVIGESIDKSNRRNATKRDCKIKKEGSFIRLPDGMRETFGCRIFKKDYSDEEIYIDTENVSEFLLKQITKYMLKH